MNTLLTITDQDIYPDAPAVDTTDFRVKEAARAIVTDSLNRIALLHVGTQGYHKLPGGGLENDESSTVALQRELLEEIGCRAEIVGEVGEIVEYRGQRALKQISYCFLARQFGDKSEPSFTEKELAAQFSIVWANSIEDAIALLSADQPKNYEGKFIQKRDLAFLRAAQTLS